MLVYRIEHKKHRCGPYRHVSSMDGLRSGEWNLHGGSVRSGSGPRHPCLRRDDELFNNFFNGLRRASDIPMYQFGFKSMEQLRDWFWTKVSRRALAKDGFVIAVFDIDRKHIVEGGKQIMFLTDYATRVRDDEIEVN